MSNSTSVYKKAILSLLSRVETKEVFAGVVEAIESHYSRSVGSVTEMKKRDNKRDKGMLFEEFCKDWLLAQDRYTGVWTLAGFRQYAIENDLPQGYRLDKQDNGIDLVLQTTKKGVVTYSAIQCKWRKKGRVAWATLSTFIGLCERTGPWDHYIVMTNAPGITRKVPKSPKDRSICVGTFRHTTREQWCKIAGVYEPHLLTEPTPKPVNEEEERERMRQARLARFSATSSSTE